MIRNITVLIAIILFGNSILSSQDSTLVFKKTRHRFAQSSFGVYQNFIPSYKAKIPSTVLANGDLDFDATSQTMLSMSGLHFWGKVDFYVNISLFTLQNRKKYPRHFFSTGIETGLKYFVWKTPYTTIASPFVGVSFNSMDYKFYNDENTSGNKIDYVRAGFHAGFATIRKDKHYFQLSGSYYYNNEIAYYFSRNAPATLKLPPVSIKIGYRYVIDASLSDEPNYESGKTKETVEKLEREKSNYLNSFGVGIGQSSAFYIKENSSLFLDYPHLKGDKLADVFPELGLSYYHHKLDANINLSFRRIKREIDGYQSSFKLKRLAFSLDMFKFLFDYHGFVPFIGISPSFEVLSANFTDSLNEIESSANKRQIKPGLIFGWDIRPNRLKTFALRTNLRFFPNLGFEDKNFTIRFHQLEFNFIQAVFYLNRMNLSRQKKE